MTLPIIRQNAKIEQFCESAMFVTRWLLAPIYLGLSLSLVILLVKFIQSTITLFSAVLTTDGSTTIVEVLSLIDLSLVANLVLMVMLAGYGNFVSKLKHEEHDDRPEWLGRVPFGVLKLRLMASIVAISAIYVLESFMNIRDYTNRELGWTVGIHLAFVVSAVLLAVMDRVSVVGPSD
ncbi:MAG: TIGR00645 family protein [Acetobacteraceae bacterium]